jgi:hypothetical protein
MGAGAGRTATQPGESADERPNRLGLREQERARRAEQQRQRDEALEAAARRRGTADRDDDEDEDPWAAPGRRRGN